MLTPKADAKLRTDHLSRQAFIYIRQSTLLQVRENTGSTARQYDLVQRAVELGWSPEQIVVVDQDQGRSGASAAARDGFQFLVAEVGLGHAGAVLSLEASRLARACSDWYRLLEICALTETLVIDEEGIYDPGQYNDRLLLGFKGTMSEAELHWLRARLLGGKLEKAQQGRLRFRAPTGLICDPSGQIGLDPDEQVQHAIRLVFDLFAQSGSALAVVKHFARHQLLIPTRLWGGTQEGLYTWEPLRHARVLSILHNPAYAGAYVYGRTQTRTTLLPGEAPRLKGRQRQVARPDWLIVQQEAHPGYITWEQFLKNQQQLDDNRTYRAEERRGAVREGAALAQGIVHCGRCGRRMTVRYLKDGTTPCYTCCQAHKALGAKHCQAIKGDGVDAALARLLLEAMQPAQLELALTTLGHLQTRAQQVEQQWELRLERARYEANLARRRFVAVEPENRLVARTLEREWNEQLQELARLEREFATLPKASIRLADPQERQRILALAQDLPAVWQAETTTAQERKQLLRCLIKDVTLTQHAHTIELCVRWQTDALTRVELPRPQPRSVTERTSPLVIERVRALACEVPDAQIAETLNEEGFHSGQGGRFTVDKVQWIRYAYEIPTACPNAPGACPSGQRADGRYSARKAAELLNVTTSTIADWCRAGVLDAIQVSPHGPRWIRLTPETIAQLRKPVRRCWKRSKSVP